MAIYVAPLFAESAKKAGLDPAKVVEQFAWWKHSEDRLDSSFWFGRDSAYVDPEVGGKKYRLRHAHLPPGDVRAKDRWTTLFRRGREKTSDRALVYAQASNGDYVLLQVLDEPGAHKIARMLSAADKKLMQDLAAQAAKFIDGVLDDFEEVASA